MIQVPLVRQQRVKGRCRHPTGWLLSGENIWCSSIIPVWPHRTQSKKWQLLRPAPTNSTKNSYLRDSDSLRWLVWSCRQIQGCREGSEWRTRLGHKNTEGKRLLDFALSCDLIISNTCFKKIPNHLTTFTSDEARTQIDYGPLWKTFHHKQEKCDNIKVIPGEEITKQRHLLVCDFHADIKHHPTPKKEGICPSPKDLTHQSEYQKAFITDITETTSSNVSGGGKEEIWWKPKSSLLKAAGNVCGSTKKHQWWRESWQWNAAVNSAVEENGNARKPGRMVAARRNTRWPSALPNILFIWENPRQNKKCSRTLHPAALTYSNLPTKWDAKSWMSKVKNLSTCNDAGELCQDDRAKQPACKVHYDCLSNVEFDWNLISLTEL